MDRLAMEIDRFEGDARSALLRWLQDHPAWSPGGEPMVWTNGKSVAADVLWAIAAARLAEKARDV